MASLRAQNALRKIAFDWDALVERTAYGAGGAGAGLAINALFGNRTLASYLGAGGLGLGGGLFLQELVNRYRQRRREWAGGRPEFTPIPNPDANQKPNLAPIPGYNPKNKPEKVLV